MAKGGGTAARRGAFALTAAHVRGVETRRAWIMFWCGAGVMYYTPKMLVVCVLTASGGR